jgi:hypothetical protein
MGFGAIALSPAGVVAYGVIIGKEHDEMVKRSFTLQRLFPGLNDFHIVQLAEIYVGNFTKQAKLKW